MAKIPITNIPTATRTPAITPSLWRGLGNACLSDSIKMKNIKYKYKYK